jgi:hypothetical protein
LAEESVEVGDVLDAIVGVPGHGLAVRQRIAVEKVPGRRARRDRAGLGEA